MVSNRMSFINSKDPFYGLDDYLNSPEIETKMKGAFFPYQLKLFDEYDNKNGLSVRSGYFYNLVSQIIYGGKIKPSLKLLNKKTKKTVLVEPDVDSKEFYIESKSLAQNRYLHLIDEQIFKYLVLSTGEYGSKKPIIFNIFRHGIRKMTEKHSLKKIKPFLKDLSKTTRFMISIPFNLILDIYNSDKSKRYSHRKSPHLDYDFKSFLSGDLNRLIAYPEETLEKFGINLENIILERYRFPENIKINNYKLNSFPILKIENTREINMKENMKKIFEDSKTHMFLLNYLNDFLNEPLVSLFDEVKNFNEEDNYIDEIDELPF